MEPIIIILIALGVLLCIYAVFYSFLKSKVQKVENAIIAKFLLKVSKIPSLIEVMRNFVADESAFESLTTLHSQAIIHRYESIYALLEHNARIQSDFSFLMKLSMQIPNLQRHAQFVYIRDFIMTYEREIKGNFSAYNTSAEKWNRFITIKNMTIIGLLLPGKRREMI